MPQGLAKADEPLVLADGTKIDPSTGAVIKEDPAEPKKIEVPTNRKAQDLVVSTRRSLVDLPEPPKTMNGIAVVLAYTLMGLSDDEIGVAVGASIQAIKQIKRTDAFKSSLENLIEGALEADEGSVRTIFHQHAASAAGKVVELMTSENEQLALRASQDVLDRSGNRPVDVVQHRHSMEGELRIRYISSGDAPQLDLGDDIIDGEIAENG